MQYIKIKSILFISLLILIPYYSVHTHPHVFIDGDVKVKFDKKGLAGFHVNWIFDTMFSDMMINDFDFNHNGKFDPKEQKTLLKDSFSNLKEFNYFILVNIEGKKFPVKFARDFKASIKNNKMIYTFFVPCHVKAIKIEKKISFAMYDQSYYTAITLQKKSPVTFTHAEKYKCNYKIHEHYKKADYFGERPAQEIIIKFRKKT